MDKRRVGIEYSPSILEPVRPGAVSPDRALCLPTFSHFVIVNKTSLSLSLILCCDAETLGCRDVTWRKSFASHGNMAQYKLLATVRWHSEDIYRIKRL